MRDLVTHTHTETDGRRTTSQPRRYRAEPSIIRLRARFHERARTSCLSRDARDGHIGQGLEGDRGETKLQRKRQQETRSLRYNTCATRCTSPPARTHAHTDAPIHQQHLPADGICSVRVLGELRVHACSKQQPLSGERRTRSIRLCEPLLAASRHLFESFAPCTYIVHTRGVARIYAANARIHAHTLTTPHGAGAAYTAQVPLSTLLSRLKAETGAAVVIAATAYADRCLPTSERALYPFPPHERRISREYARHGIFK